MPIRDGQECQDETNTFRSHEGPFATRCHRIEGAITSRLSELARPYALTSGNVIDEWLARSVRRRRRSRRTGEGVGQIEEACERIPPSAAIRHGPIFVRTTAWNSTATRVVAACRLVGSGYRCDDRWIVLRYP